MSSATDMTLLHQLLHRGLQPRSLTCFLSESESQQVMCELYKSFLSTCVLKELVFGTWSDQLFAIERSAEPTSRSMTRNELCSISIAGESTDL